MEKPRRQNHYTVEQRWGALERVAVDGCKPTDRALNMLNLPILFILRGMPGGTVETDEQPTYPPGHVYIVQEMAGWTLLILLKYEIDAPSVLLLDNFDSHVSEAGQNIVAEETSAIVCPVPTNSTSVSQPLDVGVKGSLKKKLSAECLREKVSTTKMAKQKRLGAVMRTIRAWEDILAKCVVKSFEKVIPKEPEEMV
ncbi:hypothetical protein PHMEG_00039195 [Phytophthora megakarya]|uniref:DDE-1 domain-containing protein n=1 Tax=Phytophthora megakarya TaxID=4795 RepID=A0A225UG79_9STRA|nr:hypothetical protein PHMEG_00039195 [Phytophthora megakarya]